MPYGQEIHNPAVEDVCITCEVKKGQFHLLGCDMECCPACGRQAIECDCESYEIESEDWGIKREDSSSF